MGYWIGKSSFHALCSRRSPMRRERAWSNDPIGFFRSHSNQFTQVSLPRYGLISF